MAVLDSEGWDEGAGVLECGPVLLRRPKAWHYEAWADLRRRSQETLTPWEPRWAPDELSRAAFRRRLRRYAADVREGAASPFFVFRRSDDAFVGACNLNGVRRGVIQSGSLGYWVGVGFRRTGLGAAAAEAVVRHAFEDLRLNRVEAACLPTNLASQRLLARLGFAQEGLARAYLKINGAWRDHMIFAIVRGDRDV